MLDAFRLVSAIAWSLLATWLSPCMWRSLTKRADPMDVIWGTFWFLAVNRAMYAVLGLASPGNDVGLMLCHAFGLVGVIMIVLVVRSYRAAR